MQVPPPRQTMPVGHPTPASGGAPGMHCTQRDKVVSQTGAAVVVHCALLVHPALHMNVR